MDARYVPLILAHMFRKRGPAIEIHDAVDYLAFRCRYGTPTNIRRLLALALKNGMIERRGSMIHAAFLYDKQHLLPNLPTILEGKVVIDGAVEPLT